MARQPIIWVFAVLAFLSMVPNLTCAHTSMAFRWPEVRSITKAYHFQDASHAAVDLVLKGVSGNHLYVFHCRSGLSRGMNGEEADFNGDFSCHLHSLYSHDRYESLLIENPFDVLEAHSRGEIWAEQLRGKCGEYPEWGRVRSFRLRGMSLKFEMSNVQFSGENSADLKLRSFSFKVEVTPDSTALSFISEPPSFMSPGPAFHGVFRSTELLQCGDPVPQHVSGEPTAEYIKNLGLNPPFTSIPKATIKLSINARDGASGPDPHFPEEPKELASRFALTEIKDQLGKVIYEFECRADRITRTGTIPILAGNGLQCGLFIPGKQTDLLLDSVDPYSRMSPTVILPKQLHGRAAKEPEWGNTRHFSLRGFLLTLKFTKPLFEIDDDFGQLALVRFDLTLELEPDPSAQSPIADPPKTAYRAFLPSTRAGD